MIAEGNETPGGEAGGAAEGRGRAREGDLLAERRARRAAESGEHALTLRAEAAEATVRTLETHVASLQQRLRDAEQEGQRIGEQLDAERPALAGGRAEVGEGAQPSRHEMPRGPSPERELQRASQREYAEQRLRVEAEDRGAEIERESRAEIERLGRRLSASERDAQALSARLEVVQRELAEAEQAAATERVAMLRAERALRSRVNELESGAVEMHALLESERSARRRAEQLLDTLRAAQRSAVGLLGGLAETVARLREVSIAAGERPAPARPDGPQPLAPMPAPARPVVASQPPAMPVPSEQGAVGRSPAQQPAVAAPPSQKPRAGTRPDERRAAFDEAASEGMSEALAAAVARLRARVEQQATDPEAAVVTRPAHKHSMSLITRTRLSLRRRRERRKERRER